MQELKEFENDNLPSVFRKNLFVIFFVSVLAFFFISFLTIKISFSIRDYFYKQETSKLDKNFFLQEKKKDEMKRLSSYGYIDEDEEFVHLPIEEAMEKVVNQYSKSK